MAGANLHKSLDYLIELNSTNNLRLYPGNDELLLHWRLRKRQPHVVQAWWRSNSYQLMKKVDAVTKQLHVDFLLSLKDYYLDEKKPPFLFMPDLQT
jgi:serine/threonine protein phosphatase 1